MPDNFTGWRPDLEDQHADAIATITAPLVFGAGNDPEIPQSFDTQNWKPVVSQLQRNSCAGNAQAGVRQSCNWLATKGQIVMVSRWFCYITAQIVDYGRPPGDTGVSINAAFLAGNRFGTPLEELAPYPDDSIPYAQALKFSDAANEQAQQHMLKTRVPIKSIDDYFRFVASGLGSVEVGIPWNDELANCNGFITQIPRPSKNGHAMEVFGWVWHQGERWPIDHNSHGKRWGNNGKALIRPDVFDAWCHSRLCSVQGGSDLVPFEDGTMPTREVQDWSGMA